MWIFTEIADAFDQVRKDNDAWIDSELQPWVGSTIYEDSPWYRNVGIWVAGGTLYSLNKFTTTVASGFVDILRIGDGVKEGGWGYGQDALRALAIVGPALRAARYAGSLVASVDILPRVGNCSWVAAARLLRLTGTRPLAKVADLARWSGLEVGETGPAFVREVVPALRHLGAKVHEVGGVTSMEALAEVVARNPNAMVLFSVEWTMNGRAVGHTLGAVRNFFGGMSIVDRSGRVVHQLAQLEGLYPSIGNATLYANDTIAVIRNSAWVAVADGLPALSRAVRTAESLLRESSGDKTSHAAKGKGPVGQFYSDKNCLRIEASERPVTDICATLRYFRAERSVTLWEVAHLAYGDGKKWQNIYDKNRAILGGNPNAGARAGQVLLIP
jgi:hypothetical protein